MNDLFGIRLFGRRVEEPPEMTVSTIRLLLEVREEVRRARENPREMLADFMRMGNRELRPNARPAEERAALTGGSPFFEPAKDEEPDILPTPAPAADEAFWTDLDTEHLIRLLKAHQDGIPGG